jgi:hypothetical protein
MGTSDFDAHTFAQHSSFAIGVKAHCPLNQNLRQWKRRALKPQQRRNNDQGKLAKECRALEMTFQDLASKPRLTALNLDGSVHRWRS